QAMAGAQVERLLAGEEPLDVGPAPGLRAAGHRWLAGERIVSYPSAALQTAFRGFDPTEALALARLACQVPTGGADGDEATLLVTCDELLARAQEALAADPEHPRRISYAALSTHVLAGTPRVPVLGTAHDAQGSGLGCRTSVRTPSRRCPETALSGGTTADLCVRWGESAASPRP